MNRQLQSYIIVFAATLLVALLLSACASIGRPEGGERDVTPPTMLRANPRSGSLNFNGRRLDLYFDENVQLEDAFNKVVVSPVQIAPPQVSANGRHVRVELRDTLIPNTTYTIDFADAVKDLNEGNVLDGLAIDFSTGASIDSLRISGMVLEARNLEPAQGMIVGAYSNLEDSAITKVPMERIARTDQYGRFTIRGLKDIEYQIFAVNDVNRDYKWDRSENVAFYDTPIKPSVEHITVSDTLRAGDGVSDSIVSRPGIRYLPNDVLLTWFNEDYKPQYLKDYGRPDRRRLTVTLAAPCTLDSLPVLTIANGPHAGRNATEWAVLNACATGDTLEYWIRDPEILATDSLMMSIRYQRTDSLDRLTWTNDTVRMFYRDHVDKKKKKNNEEENDSIPKIEFLGVSFLGSSQDVYLPLRITLSQPLDSIDHAGYRLEIARDTLWLPVEGVRFEEDPLHPVLGRVMHVDWKPGEKYRLSIDSLALNGIYGEHNKPTTQEFTVKALEDYSNLTISLSPNPGNAVVELLSSSDEAAYVQAATDGKAVFKYVNPGEYYVRLFIDTNGNGKWDTGALSDSIHVQPEEVYYFSKKLNLRKNWDVDQAWNIYELPLDMQKPFAILKNKPKLRNGEKDSRDISDTEEEEENPWDTTYDQMNRRDNQRSNNRNRQNKPGGVRANTGNAAMRR